MYSLFNKIAATRGTIKILIISSFLCILLQIFRMQWADNYGYIFLTWNLFLAWIPFFISSAIIKGAKAGIPLFVLLLMLGAWLAFFPNAPYILTDLFHLKHKSSIPMWFDLMLILCFAWNGLMAGFLSLLDIQKFIRDKSSNTTAWLFVVFVLVSSSYGVYLGRFERWNSWDIVFNPIYLAKDILGTFTHLRTFGVTFLFSVFMIVSYLTLFNLVKSGEVKEA